MSTPPLNSQTRREAAVAVKLLVRLARKGALATLDLGSAGPYASLVTVATDIDGAPLLLLSTLARHTRNLTADPRASLLIDATSGSGDPLEGGRVTLVGCMEKTSEPRHRRRFLARHDGARSYADFSDFAFYRLDIEGAHYVGGFGRIVDLEPGDILTDVSRASALVAAESEIVGHMNADHAEAVALYAGLAGVAPAGTGSWCMSGIDPEGCDLIRQAEPGTGDTVVADQGGRQDRAASGETAAVGQGDCVRVAFAEAIECPGDARRALAELAAKARTRAETSQLSH